MKFTTSTGEINISYDRITFNRKVNYEYFKNILFFIFFLFCIYKVSSHIRELLNGAKFYPFIIIFVMGIIVYSLLAFDFVIRQVFSNSINIDNIKKIHIIDLDNTLEVSVVIFVKSGRYKKFFFRYLENQHKAFINELIKLNTSILIEDFTSAKSKN